MNITWFSEIEYSGKTPRNHPNMRTEFAWFVAQDAMHHNISKLLELPDNSVDIGVIIIPKKAEHYANIDVAVEMRRVCKKYAFMQEGPSWFFQSLPLSYQLWFYNIMLQSDFVLAHNDIDKEYYEGLLGKPTFINPTLMIEDPISIEKSDRSGVIIGGNLVRWYGGFNSLIVASVLKEKIYAPQMGRMEQAELSLGEINHLPYLQWNEWLKELNKFKYAVHLNPNTIGGTFHLNCAYLGIPCIGNINTNTQRLCFPTLSVEPHDVGKAKKLISMLSENKHFYEECSKYAKKAYQDIFSEEQYKINWKNIIQQI